MFSFAELTCKDDAAIAKQLQCEISVVIVEKKRRVRVANTFFQTRVNHIVNGYTISVKAGVCKANVVNAMITNVVCLGEQEL
jgi:hypothetical protein